VLCDPRQPNATGCGADRRNALSRGTKCRGICLYDRRFIIGSLIKVGAYYYPRLNLPFLIYFFTMPSTNQSNAFTFTINNYTEDDERDVHKLVEFASYLVCGKEIGEKCKTPHLQGYVFMINKCTIKALSRFLRRARLAVAKGTDFDNTGYAQKEELWLKHGTPPCQGKRNDLIAAKETTSMKECILSGGNYQAVRMMEKKLLYLEPKRDFKPIVIWAYGSTGTGKSKGFYDAFGIDNVFTPKNYKWWEGYDADEVVLLDDIRGDFCKFHELLTLLDAHPYRVECKGGSRQLRARYMLITSPYHPASLYQGRTSEDIQQLLRRITHIVLVTGVYGSEVHEFM